MDKNLGTIIVEKTSENLKLSNSDNYELPIVDKLSKSNEVLSFKLDKDLTPIAYKNKVKELIKQGACSTVKEAESMVDKMVFNLEIYYSIDSGLFAVESEAVESGLIYNPYTGEMLYKADDY